MPVVYFSFCVSVLIGIAFRRRQSLKPLSIATAFGALQFFLITNFGVWVLENFYPRSLSGLTTCFIAAIPYFGNTLAGDSFYALVLFGGFALLERYSPALSATGSSSLPGYGD